MQVVTGEVIDCGCDWITLTQVSENSYTGEQLLEDTQVRPTIWLIAEELKEVYDIDLRSKDVSFGGYTGLSWANGGQKFGWRARDGKTDAILQVSGETAGNVAEYIDMKSYISDDGLRVTRFDHQVTVKVDFPDPNLVSDFYDVLVQSSEEGSPLCGRRKPTLYRSSSDTIYIGSRSSKGDLYRIYDRSAKYGMEKGCVWRFEVERGRDTARDGFIGFFRRCPPDRTFDLSAEFLVKCGITFKTNAKDITDRGYSKFTADQQAEMIMDDVREKRLRWLRRCVRGPLRELIHYGALDDAILALGLERFV